MPKGASGPVPSRDRHPGAHWSRVPRPRNRVDRRVPPRGPSRPRVVLGVGERRGEVGPPARPRPPPLGPRGGAVARGGHPLLPDVASPGDLRVVPAAAATATTSSAEPRPPRVRRRGGDRARGQADGPGREAEDGGQRRRVGGVSGAAVASGRSIHRIDVSLTNPARGSTGVAPGPRNTRRPPGSWGSLRTHPSASKPRGPVAAGGPPRGPAIGPDVPSPPPPQSGKSAGPTLPRRHSARAKRREGGGATVP